MTFQKIILVHCEYRPIGTFKYKAVHSCGKESKSHKNNKRNFVLFRQSRVSQGQVSLFQSFKTFFLLFNQNLFTILKFQFGFEILDFGIFLGRKICQVVFWVA